MILGVSSPVLAAGPPGLWSSMMEQLAIRVINWQPTVTCPKLQEALFASWRSRQTCELGGGALERPARLFSDSSNNYNLLQVYNL